MGRAERWLHLVKVALRSLQVELQGKYSMERLFRLDQYCQRTSTLRVVLATMLTPMPCLLSIVMMEVIPLADWRSGLPHSQMFWVRGFLVVFLIAFAVLEQSRHFVPRLPMTDAQLWGSSIFTAGGTVVVMYFIASKVGFPIPFTIAVGSPSVCFFLGICIAIFCGRFLKENASELTRLIKYVLVVSVQVAMTYVYPGYNFIFVRLNPTAQLAFAFLLPVLKILIKNWIGFLFRTMDDVKPEVVILNAEIFHALFVSWCMQRSTSTYTTVMLLAMDFLEAALSLRDIQHILNDMNKALANAKERIRLHSSHTIQDSPGLMTISMLIWEKDSTIRESSEIQSASHITKHRSPSSKSVHPNQTFLPAENWSIEPAGNSWNAKNDLPSIKVSETQFAKQLVCDPADTNKIKESDDTPASSYAMEIVDGMTKSERLRYLKLSLQVLHIAEFLVLVEFTEVIVPIVYCIYLAIVYRLPNKVYYAQLRGVDDATLQRNLFNVMAYSLLELVSFLMLSYMLQRKVGVSSLRQLGFVLSTQRQVAQSKFVLWIVHSVQTPLDHFGADFSFKFQWLHGNTTSIMGE